MNKNFKKLIKQYIYNLKLFTFLIINENFESKLLNYFQKYIQLLTVMDYFLFVLFIIFKYFKTNRMYNYLLDYSHSFTVI